MEEIRNPVIRFAQYYRQKHKARHRELAAREPRPLPRTENLSLFDERNPEMPKDWDAATEPEGLGSDFLKLKDKEAALVMLMGPPMILSKHTLEDGTQIGREFHCGTPEGLGCPVCDNPSAYEFKDARISQKGLYPIWVEWIEANGKKQNVQKHMILGGGWSVIGAFKEAKKAQEDFGDTIEGIALYVSKTGEKMQTKYTIVPKEKVLLNPEGDPVDVENVGMKFIAKNHREEGYESEADQFAGHPGEKETESEEADTEREDSGEVYADRAFYLKLADEAGFKSDATLKAYLKSQNVVVRTADDYPTACAALQRRIDKQTGGVEADEVEDAFATI